MKTKTTPSRHVWVANEQLKITVEQLDRTIVIVFAGELDSAVEAEVTQTVGTAAATAGIVGVRVDVSAITFIDSSGVRCLLLARQAATDRDIAFTLTGASNKFVLRILEMCGLAEYLVTPTMTSNTSDLANPR